MDSGEKLSRVNEVCGPALAMNVLAEKDSSELALHALNILEDEQFGEKAGEFGGTIPIKGVPFTASGKNFKQQRSRIFQLFQFSKTVKQSRDVLYSYVPSYAYDVWIRCIEATTQGDKNAGFNMFVYSVEDDKVTVRLAFMSPGSQVEVVATVSNGKDVQGHSDLGNGEKITIQHDTYRDYVLKADDANEEMVVMADAGPRGQFSLVIPPPPKKEAIVVEIPKRSSHRYIKMMKYHDGSSQNVKVYDDTTGDTWRDGNGLAKLVFATRTEPMQTVFSHAKYGTKPDLFRVPPVWFEVAIQYASDVDCDVSIRLPSYEVIQLNFPKTGGNSPADVGYVTFEADFGAGDGRLEFESPGNFPHFYHLIYSQIYKD